MTKISHIAGHIDNAMKYGEIIHESLNKHRGPRIFIYKNVRIRKPCIGTSSQKKYLMDHTEVDVPYLDDM